MRFIYCVAVAVTATSMLIAADPTFLRRYLPDIAPVADDLTANASGVLYRPAFGVGDAQASQLKSIARYGELTVSPGGCSASVSYAAEEQIYFMLEGNGILLYADQRVSVKKHDYTYLPVGVKHGIANLSGRPVRLLVMGFKIPRGTNVAPTPNLKVP